MAETQQQQSNQDGKSTNAAAAARNTNNSNANNTGNNTTTHSVSVSLVGNPRYFLTVPGILKIIEWVFAIIAIACSAPALFNGAHWFLFVVIVCFICTFMWMCIHFFTITNVISSLPWLILEMVFAATATVLYFVAMIVMFVETNDHYRFIMFYFGPSRYDACITAACFGLLNFIVYGIEAGFHFKTWWALRRG